jgi:hypothetical protein
MVEGEEYGLGLDLRASSAGLFGHHGNMPGYDTAVRHSADSGVTLFAASTGGGLLADRGMSQLLLGFADLSGSAS